VPRESYHDLVPTIGASVFASIAGWIVDSILEPWAPLFARIMIGLVVSTLVFYRVRYKLRELRGD